MHNKLYTVIKNILKVLENNDLVIKIFDLGIMIVMLLFKKIINNELNIFCR